jgi:hypothetical protein
MLASVVRMRRFAPPLAMVLLSILGLVSRDCLNSVIDKATDSSRTHGDGPLGETRLRREGRDQHRQGTAHREG